MASRSSEVNFTKNYMLLLYSRRGPIRTDVSSFDSGSELIAFSGGGDNEDKARNTDRSGRSAILLST